MTEKLLFTEDLDRRNKDENTQSESTIKWLSVGLFITPFIILAFFVVIGWSPKSYWDILILIVGFWLAGFPIYLLHAFASTPAGFQNRTEFYENSFVPPIDDDRKPGQPATRLSYDKILSMSQSNLIGEEHILRIKLTNGVMIPIWSKYFSDFDDLLVFLSSQTGIPIKIE